MLMRKSGRNKGRETESPPIDDNFIPCPVTDVYFLAKLFSDEEGQKENYFQSAVL